MKRMLVVTLLCIPFVGWAYKQVGAASSSSQTPGSLLHSLLVQSATNIVPTATRQSTIAVDYPSEDSTFPPDMFPPLFQWRDANKEVTIWRIDVSFPESGGKLRFWSSGDKMQIGYVDLELVGFVPPKLTPEQEAGHSWRPDQRIWDNIKAHAVGQPVIVRFAGFHSRQNRTSLSSGQVTLQISKDPVGAPIFYRDVPQLPPPVNTAERGVIKPLPDSLLPKIRWRLRSVSEPQSKVVMEGLPTCANCHSVSRDGKTLGIDVDGPQNDKGLYALIPIKKVSSISNDYIIHWSASTEDRAQKRYGFMSQVSPDGNYVINSIAPPQSTGARIADRLYNGAYSSYGFGQVFYPTRGILGWYGKDTGKLQPLPGGDDPNYVQTSGFWSPDGKYIIFSRGIARDPYGPGRKQSTYANDPNETQMQYDLYRIPFNEGRGGRAERVIGASENGMSNNFPKVSPDGKWIVFVQNKNGLLMRPDSRLFIIPFEGGEARPLRSNLPTMNSWHSFSPNGRWLVFSSKSQSADDSSKDPDLYTRMYLTHIDENGNSSPAIRVENATAANRAVNIPEFINIADDGLERIDAPATEFYKLFDFAVRLSDKRQFEAAIPAWKKALELDPKDPRAHNNLGIALVASGQINDALGEYRKSLELNPSSSQTENNFGSALAESGNIEEAKAHFEKALMINPYNSAAEVNLGNAFLAEGGHLDDAIEHLKRGTENQDSSDGENGLGVSLARSGKLDEAIVHLKKAVDLAPQIAGYHYNLGRILAAANQFADALRELESAAKLSNMQDPAALQMMAAMYSENYRYKEAISTASRALELAIEQHNDPLGAELRANLARYQSQASAALATH